MTSQSGSYYPYSTADKAVDGNRDREMEGRSCVHPGMLHFSRRVIDNLIATVFDKS